MKAELTIPQELVEQIAERVVQKVLPILETLRESERYQYLTVDELSVMLGKSKAQIYQWANNARHGLSDFPYKKAGRSLLFSKKEIENWLKSNKSG